MICPKCLERTGEKTRMNMRHSYKVGMGQKYYIDLCCSVCRFPAVGRFEIVDTDPDYGNGAYSWAKSENRQVMVDDEDEPVDTTDASKL